MYIIYFLGALAVLSYGKIMESPRKHYNPVEAQWKSHGSTMGAPWESHRSTSEVPLKKSHKSTTDALLWSPTEEPLKHHTGRLRWDRHEITMEAPWDHNGGTMEAPWFTLESPCFRGITVEPPCSTEAPRDHPAYTVLRSKVTHGASKVEEQNKTVRGKTNKWKHILSINS